MSWCLGNGEPIVYSWGKTDLKQILREAALKGIEFSPEEQQIFARWRDLQQEFDELVKSVQDTSLGHAAAMCGFAEEGKAHDAYWDAWNTARIYEATRDREAFVRSIEKVNRILNENTEPVTLGSLIDFSGIVPSA